MNVAREKDLLTEVDAASKLNVSVKTLQRNRYMSRGLPYVKIGKTVRYRITDIEAYISSHIVRPTACAGSF